jgi:hypothetical protein
MPHVWGEVVEFGVGTRVEVEVEVGVRVGVGRGEGVAATGTSTVTKATAATGAASAKTWVVGVHCLWLVVCLIGLVGCRLSFSVPCMSLRGLYMLSIVHLVRKKIYLKVVNGGFIYTSLQSALHPFGSVGY